MATLCLTLAAPGPVAGMALCWPIDGSRIYDSPVMIVMAETLRSLPYALAPLAVPAIVSPGLSRCGRLDGLDRPRQFLRVVLPLSLRPLLAAWAIAFAIGLGELPATNLAAPPGVSQMPVSVLIWGLLHTGVESHLAGVALIMLMVVAAQASSPPRPSGRCERSGGRRRQLRSSSRLVYFFGSFGFSPPSTALIASLSWSSRCGPPPTNSRATCRRGR